MLNLVMRRLNQRLLSSNIYRFSLQSDLLGSELLQEQHINDIKSYLFYNNHSSPTTQPQNFSAPVFGNRANLKNIEGQRYPLNQNLDRSINENEKIYESDHFLHLGSQMGGLNFNNGEISEFNTTLSPNTRKQNSERLAESISNVLKENEQRQFGLLLRNFINSDRFKKFERETRTQEKKLFKKAYTIFLKGVEEREVAQSLLKIFSESNPKLIKIDYVQKGNDTENWMRQFDQRFSNKVMLQPFKKRIDDEKIESPAKSQEKQKNQTLDFIEKLENRSSTKTKAKAIKLHLKKQPEVEKLRIDKESLEQVEKKLFGNKKILTEHIIFKRTAINKVHQKQNKFGENWVYAYDLPYELDKELALRIIEMISLKYGEIVEFRGQSFQNFVEKSYTETILHIPENYQDDSTRKRVKIQAEKSIKQQTPKKSKKKQIKEKAIRIMEKCKLSKDLSLNKSTMVFKFKNKQDKTKFLSNEMRLYGLCISKLRNIRFEEAQSKCVVALSMIPWACESAHLLKFINDALISLKISVTHPNCIIANGYVFLELANFYEALHAKDLLNNLIFQNQRIKAQLCYGSSYIYEGEYRYNFEQDHYEKLLQKLSQGRLKYSNQLLK